MSLWSEFFHISALSIRLILGPTCSTILLRSSEDLRRSSLFFDVGLSTFNCRPLIPGLTTMDWERSFQDACVHSEQPTNLVLHECS